MQSLSFGKHQGSYNTTKLKTNLSSLVFPSYSLTIIKFLDEIKYAIRRPTRYAISEPNKKYLDIVQ
jgi:hypothetical protein